MKPTYVLHQGDCREIMRELADCSVDAIVTDPPYELGFMGKTWDSSGIAYDPEVWRQALRVLKPGGHLLAFSGTRTYHRMACAIEDAGFELRDQIGWLYGSGFPKSRNIAEHDMDGADAERWAGWGTALKPAWEPICVARKPLAGTVAQNVLAHGTGALNIDSCRVGNDVLPAITAGQAKLGTFERGTMVTAERVGRWPANVIHDGSDEVLAAFPNAPGQLADTSLNAGARKTQNVYGAMQRGRDNEASADSENQGAVGFKMRPGARRLDTGTAARFFYCAKASREDRNEGCEHMERKPLHWSSGDQNPGSFQAEGTDKTSQNNHPTVKPTDLMAYLCRLVTPPGGVVLDPFMGSGSTGKAAVLEGFDFIGIDLDRDADGNPLGHLEIARARIEFAARQPRQRGLFEEAA